MKVETLTPVFVETISKDIEEGKIYISKRYGVAIHLCACGCKGKTVMDFKPLSEDGWDMIEEPDRTITFKPSVGNFNGENPYHAHYYITNNKIVWI